jgi:hypothetical protein
VLEERMPISRSSIVPVELLLARTDTDAVLVTDLRAYPTGLEFALTARPHPDQLQQRRHDPDRPHRFVYRDFWLEVRGGRSSRNGLADELSIGRAWPGNRSSRASALDRTWVQSEILLSHN